VGWSGRAPGRNGGRHWPLAGFYRLHSAEEHPGYHCQDWGGLHDRAGHAGQVLDMCCTAPPSTSCNQSARQVMHGRAGAIVVDVSPLPGCVCTSTLTASLMSWCSLVTLSHSSPSCSSSCGRDQQHINILAHACGIDRRAPCIPTGYRTIDLMHVDLLRSPAHKPHMS
jgi:hypothetical protein